MRTERGRKSLLAGLERALLAVLLLVALVLRSRDLRGGFDREMEGFQGAFFATAAVNYARLGFSAFGGYPVLNIDLDPARPSTWYTYENHPPTVAWIAFGALKLLAPAGWDEAWRSDVAPQGVEPALRLPFLAMHMLALFALWWALRQASGPLTAMVALALAASCPVLVLYGVLANYENAALPFVLFAFGFHARYLRAGKRADLALLALCLGLGSSMTFAPLFFVPFLFLHASLAGSARRALAVLLGSSVASLAPLLLHALASAHALESIGSEPLGLLARAEHLLEPLVSGQAPIHRWALLQVERGWSWLSPPLLPLACVGLLLLLRRRMVRNADPVRRVDAIDLGLPLFLGGALYLLAFYRHTLEPQHSFLMLLAPGVLALAATALSALGRASLALRGGLAPLALLVSLIASLGAAKSNELRYRYRADRDERPDWNWPRPELDLPKAIGTELSTLLPPRSLGLYPAELGFNHAVSFYAWRTLLPIQSLDDPLSHALAERFGLSQASRFLVLPNPPHPPSAAASIERLSAALPPSASTISGQRWLVHRLP